METTEERNSKQETSRKSSRVSFARSDEAAKEAANTTATPELPVEQHDPMEDLSKAIDDLAEENEMAEDSELKDIIADARNMRRIIAEDPEYNLAIVPNLEMLALRRIIDNFVFDSTMYKDITGKHRETLLQRMDLRIPLKVVANIIEEDAIFWQRLCRSRWQICDIAQHGKSWKRLYFERNLHDIIESYIPGKTDNSRLEEALELSAMFVKKLVITQLLPPLKEEQPLKDAGADDTSDVESQLEEPPPYDHFEFSPVLAKLTNLTELRIMYNVKSCGMNFEWNIFQFTMRDCVSLAKAVASAHQLKVFHLTRSKVDCDKCRVLIYHILDHPVLEELDLSFNKIGDRGARALGKFINGHSKLKVLRVTANQIRVGGANAIAYALKRNALLQRLDLRMNRITDEGACSIANSMFTNQTLTHVNLAANEFSEPAAAVLAQLLAQNKQLIVLDLSNNKLGLDGGKQLQDGIQQNETLQKIDLRFTECGQEAEYYICQKVDANREAKCREEESDAEIREFFGLPPKTQKNQINSSCSSHRESRGSKPEPVLPANNTVLANAACA